MRNTSIVGIRVVWVLLLSMVAGCASESTSRQQLSAGYQALEAKQYDAALAAADEQLRRSPAGPGSAEAHYLRGRALEQRQAISPDAATLNLQAARRAYLEALGHQPSPRLAAYIRASLGNVHYFLDDYESAVREWSAAYPLLTDPAIQAWVLYRIGLSQQRLGQFERADRTFEAVQQRFPNTVPAQRAAAHHGSRGFSVQLATYANKATAEQAMALLKQEGVTAQAVPDPQGRTVIRAGPFGSYQHAVALKQRYAERYPDALITP